MTLEFSTIPELLLFQSRKFNNPQTLNLKGSTSVSNQEFFVKTFHLACGLKKIGLTKGQAFGNLSYQNPTWLIVDFGAILAGAITVPIFHNIAKDNLLYEINDASIQYFFTDDEEVFDAVKNYNPSIKLITAGFLREDSFNFDELITLGKKVSEEENTTVESFLKNTREEDLATIIYTSGSTGRPKGVELTHLNLISQIKATAKLIPLQTSAIALSFLPLAHIFERMVVMFYISQGISIHFADDVKNIGNLLRELRPTLITTVPRVLEKVFAKINSGIEEKNLIGKFLGKKALQRALKKDVERRGNFYDRLLDLLIYKKFRNALGGKIQMIICGGASLSEDLERFYHNIGVSTFCGYGLTETSPVLAVNYNKYHKLGTVGKAFPGVELKIAADSELLARGPNIMRGYHNQPEKTSESFADGWFKTGDLASIDEDGFVKIIGRKKELFKTANGKYVSPIPIEQKLVQEFEFLIGAIVIAEARKFTSAILFPDFENLKIIKEKLKFLGGDQAFLESKNLCDFAQKKIDLLNKNLDHCEQIQKFYIATRAISIESGDVTPSMKLKRGILEEKFKNIIEKFYAE